jgi:hypothetical protein
MYRFKTSQDTDDAVMERAMEARACQLTLPVIRMFPSRRCKSAIKKRPAYAGRFFAVASMRVLQILFVDNRSTVKGVRTGH